MVLIARNRTPGKYTKANLFYHWGRITAKVLKKVSETRTASEFTDIPSLDSLWCCSVHTYIHTQKTLKKKRRRMLFKPKLLIVILLSLI